MMTEAEALRTLALEDPAVAEDAKAALRLLTSGGGLAPISMLRLQEFLWGTLPGTMPQATERHLAVARALARLLGLAGMERYAEVCADTETARIINAYAGSRDEGLSAYAKALSISHAVPPDTDLLAWSTVMGPDERAAYDACGAAIELAVAAGELKVGVSGWKTKRAALVERWLTQPSCEPDADTWLSKISAERIDEWAHGHPGERSALARRLMPRLLEPPDLPDEPLPTLRWLLRHADAGLRLTARHYIAPTLVGEAAGLFGWAPPRGSAVGGSVIGGGAAGGGAAGGGAAGGGAAGGGAAGGGVVGGGVVGGVVGGGVVGGAGAAGRYQELEVYPLHVLRGLAQHEMGAVRRSGNSLVLSRTGRLMADDAAVRWHIGTAALIGPDDGPDPDFTVAVREAALLVITLSNGPVDCEELAIRLTELHALEGWASRSGGSLAGAIRSEIHVLRHRLRALQLLDESASPAPGAGASLASGVGCSPALALTGTGTAAALSALLARALRPRRHEHG